MRDFQRRLTNGFYALVSLPATAMGFALSIQISALSWLLTTRYHLDIHQVGIVWAAGPLAGIVGQVIKLRAIYETLEGVTDRCEDVANIIESVLVKYS